MKIYFAGSIRGGRRDKENYECVIEYLKKFGEVLTEHVGDKNLTNMGEERNSESYIFNRDVKWLRESDVIVIDVSTPSLGVGYEIRLGEELRKKMLLLHHERKNESLSPMISGNEKFEVRKYNKVEEALKHIDEFFKGIKD